MLPPIEGHSIHDAGPDGNQGVDDAADGRESSRLLGIDLIKAFLSTDDGRQLARNLEVLDCKEELSAQ